MEENNSIDTGNEQQRQQRVRFVDVGAMGGGAQGSAALHTAASQMVTSAG